MRYTIIFLLVTFISTQAQTDTGKVDLSKLVQQQIQLAQAKQAAQLLQSTQIIQQPNVNQDEQAVVDTTFDQTEAIVQQAALITKEDNFTAEVVTRQPHVIKRIPKVVPDNGYIWKILVILTASAIIFGYVIYRRYAKMAVPKKKSNIKKNVTILREEKVGSKQNPYLKQIRTNLLATAGQGELSEEAITNAARKLRISREEILLANRIRSHQMMNA